MTRRPLTAVCLVVLALVLGVAPLDAQQATSVQESTQILVGPSAGQNYSTAGGTGTITITPTQPCTYIWEVDSSPFNGTNTTATNGFVTLTAGNVVQKWTVAVPATAQLIGTGFIFAPAKPFKTTATTITLTTPTGLANATWNVNIWYAFGPC